MSEACVKDFQENIHLLRAAGVVEIQIHYSGGGDSGGIDSVDIHYEKGVTTDPNVKLSGIRVHTHFDDEEKEWKRDLVNCLLNITDWAKNFADQFVDALPFDWYNDDGGWGQVTLDVLKGTVSSKGYVYETISHEADSREWVLDTDKEDAA